MENSGEWLAGGCRTVPGHRPLELRQVCVFCFLSFFFRRSGGKGKRYPHYGGRAPRGFAEDCWS